MSLCSKATVRGVSVKELAREASVSPTPHPEVTITVLACENLFLPTGTNPVFK